MTTTAPRPPDPTPAHAPTTVAAWRGFASGAWQDGIDVRDFIQRNYTPYTGDGGLPAGCHRADQRASGTG